MDRKEQMLRNKTIPLVMVIWLTISWKKIHGSGKMRSARSAHICFDFEVSKVRGQTFEKGSRDVIPIPKNGLISANIC